MTAKEKGLWFFHRLLAMSPLEMIYRLYKEGLAVLERKRTLAVSRYVTDSRYAPDTPIPLQKKNFYFDLDTFRETYRAEYPEAYTELLRTARRILEGQREEMGEHSGAIKGNNWPLVYSRNIEFRNRDDMGDIRLAWEDGRHYQLVILAKAYYVTGDKKYLDGLKERFYDWIHKNPVNMGIHYISSMELAIRLQSWLWCYYLTDEEDTGFQRDLLTAIRHHCLHIRRNLSLFSSANNHLIVETASLCIASILLPQLLQDLSLFKKSMDILRREVIRQTFSDGVNKEQAFHYQAFVMESLFLFMLAAKRNGIPIPQEIYDVLERMCEFIRNCMDREGHIPNVGDSDDGHVLNIIGREFNGYLSLLNLAEVFFDRVDFAVLPNHFDEQALWLLGEDYRKSSGHIALLPSRVYKEGGYSVLRYNDEDRERLLLFDHGPLSLGTLAAHGHADALSICLHVDGKPVFIDPGTYIYNIRKEWRNFFRRTANHNTVCIDGRDQSQMLGPFIWGRKAVCKLIDYRLDQQIETVCGQHNGYKPLIHCRRVTFIKPDIFIVEDRFLKAVGNRDFELTYQIAPGFLISTGADGISLRRQDVFLFLAFFQGPRQMIGSVEKSWISPQFGRKFRGNSIKLRGKVLEGLPVYTIITIGKKARNLHAQGEEISFIFKDTKVHYKGNGVVVVEQEN
ncbi:MAG: alginate lyase family protein [Clostridia bacterium]|jgi:hypothetical protein